MSPRRLWTLIRREVQATFRDRFTVAILVVVPIFALAMFGFVLTTDVEHLSLGLFDAARSAASRRIAAELAANGTFDVQEFESTDAIGDALVRGRIHYTKWTDSAGIDRYGCEIIAETVDFLSRAKAAADEPTFIEDEVPF